MKDNTTTVGVTNTNAVKQMPNTMPDSCAMRGPAGPPPAAKECPRVKGY